MFVGVFALVAFSVAYVSRILVPCFFIWCINRNVAISGYQGPKEACAIWGSEVAGNIGLHRYGAPIEALVRVWGRLHKPSLRHWERLTGGIRLPEVTFARHASSHVHAAVGAASRIGDGLRG